MLTAIEFNNESLFMAIEVNDVRRQWMLAAKFQAGQLFAAERTP